MFSANFLTPRQQCKKEGRIHHTEKSNLLCAIMFTFRTILLLFLTLSFVFWVAASASPKENENIPVNFDARKTAQKLTKHVERKKFARSLKVRFPGSAERTKVLELLPTKILNAYIKHVPGEMRFKIWENAVLSKNASLSSRLYMAYRQDLRKYFFQCDHEKIWTVEIWKWFLEANIIYIDELFDILEILPKKIILELQSNLKLSNLMLQNELQKILNQILDEWKILEPEIYRFQDLVFDKKYNEARKLLFTLPKAFQLEAVKSIPLASFLENIEMIHRQKIIKLFKDSGDWKKAKKCKKHFLITFNA